ncbi:MAG: hypothetical protein ABR537_08815 [Gemmatimonadales bacterium]
MNRFIRLPLAGAAALLVFGCRGDTVSPKTDGPMFAVSDGAHQGNPDFFFLPPLFKNPNTDAHFEPTAFNARLRPAVEICELGAPASTTDNSRECIGGAALKRFDPSAVTVSLTDQQYQVNWKTDEKPLDPAKFYRIRVLVGSAVLGFADIDPVSSSKELKNVQTNEYIPLLDGRTLPIKFRIESGALCATDGTPCAGQTINLSQGGEIELFGAGEDFKLDIPPATAATFGGQPVTNVTFNLETCSGIDVDLPTYGPCLRVATYFDGTGSGELEFSKPLLISMCVLSSEIHTPDETRQEGLITLHQQDGTLIRALPHAAPNCNVVGASGWDMLKSLAARLLAPQSAYAATHSALLHVGGGGETGLLGGSCSSGSAFVPQGIMMTVLCPPASPALSGPQGSATATITPPHTVTDFQFALPAKMEYLNPDDAQRTGAPGASLPTAVKVTDWDGTAVQGARVTFYEPAIEGPATVLGTATSNSDGVAQISWTIRAGQNTAIATGRGIAAQNNYPDATVKPFMPDIAQPTNLQIPVALGTGRITFFATGTTGLTGYQIITSDALVQAGQFNRDAVQCPAGKVVVGGGAQVAGEGSADFNTRLRESGPSTVGAGASARDVWLVSIQNDDASDHTVRMFVACANPPAGYEVMTSADFTLTTGGGFHREAVQCSAGKSILSGGAQVVGEGTGNFYVKLQEDAPGSVGAPGSTRDVWLVSMKNQDEVQHTARISAVCASPLSGYEVKTSSDFSLAADGGFDRQSVLCTGAKAVTGGGAQVAGEGVADFGTRLQESAPGTVGLPAQDGWLVSMKNEDGSAHTGRAFTVCVDASRGP